MTEAKIIGYESQLKHSIQNQNLQNQRTQATSLTSPSKLSDRWYPGKTGRKPGLQGQSTNGIFSELMKHDEEVKTFFLRRSVKWPSFILRQTEDDFNDNDLERHSLLSARVEKNTFSDWLKR